ncbi:MAG TPA: permease-like cell division protein FtsX [Gaiellaceae bacterium]|nr:permease-like cell division protein FtsX [Gaiellaceae bacterium]
MSRLRVVVSEAFRSLGANLSTTVAATMTVLIGMFLLGLFIALGTWVVAWSDHVKSELDVKVYFADAASPRQVNAVRIYLANEVIAGRVKDYRFVSKDEALAEMRKTNPDLVNSLSSNPLPASYVVTPKQAEQVKSVAADIRAQHFKGLDHSDSDVAPGGVQDGKQYSKRVLDVARVLELVFLIAVIVLLAASTLLIANTIRLSIFSRRREIEVMKLVGATNWFVRGPFMLEGLFCGVLGSVAAVVLLLVSKEIVLPALEGHVHGSSGVKALAFSLNALILLGVGLGVGAVGSGLTMRRFLRV